MDLAAFNVNMSELAWVAAAAALLLAVVYVIFDVLSTMSIPSITVEATKAESEDEIVASVYDPSKPCDKDVIPCYDPANMQLLGYMPAMSAAQVKEMIAKAKEAQQEWKKSSFAQRRKLLKILLKFIIENQETICRVASRDSGKPMVDAILGEVIVTCEKIHWLCNEGEKWLKPEKRSAGIMAFYKSPRVEFHPVGVVGAIVPWNYPFHNVLNPLTAAVFAGNAIVIKVSEYASWSSGYYSRMINAALEAAGAPPNLVQIVTGYGEAGNAVVTQGSDKVIFVGSTVVGKKVMAAAAETLTPVVLELGGKDAFIVCDDANIDSIIQVALKAAYLNSGQNCAGGERFFIHEKVVPKFTDAVVGIVKKMRQGPPLASGQVDAGAMCMPGLAQKIQALVDDAVSKGAKLLAGGKIPETLPGQFYPPTVLLGINKSMKIWEEEVFGPVMSIIPWSTDDEVVGMANDCPFGLGSNVFSGSQSRARALCARMEAGMSSVNDFATTYMCQSLPFGGVKQSGFDRFAGIEGLRGLCVPKAVAEDAVPWLMKSSIPPPWQVPLPDIAFPFGKSLVTMFFGPGLMYKIAGVLGLAQIFIAPGTLPKAKKDKES